MKKLICLSVILISASAWGQVTPSIFSTATINGTSLTAPFTYNGSTVLWFPAETSGGASETFVGLGACAGCSSAPAISFIATCVGFYTCGGSSGGMTGNENTAIGWHSMNLLTSGTQNTALGVNTLGFETTGSNNVAVGTDAMRNGVGISASTCVGESCMHDGVGIDNVAIGYQSMVGQSNATSTGNNNAVVGFKALGSTLRTTAFGNSSLGFQTLYATTSGNNNSVVGYDAGTAITTGANNVALGANSLTTITTQSNNIAIGTNAMQATDSDANEIAIGYGALFGQVGAAGGNDIAIGYNAMGSTSRTSAASNVAIGSRVIQGCTSCTNNVVLGFHAGENNITSAGSNVIIGTSVGSTTLATGSTNILIGTSSAVDTIASATNNEININNTIIDYNTAASVSSGAGTSPTVTGGGTHVFKVTYGATGTPTTTLVIAMPAAPADWVCPAVLDRTSTSITGRQSGAAAATTVTVTWSSAPANGDVIELMCGAL